MGSSASGRSHKRKTLGVRFKPGIIAKPRGDRRTREIRDASNLLQQAHADLGGLDALPVTLSTAAERWAFTVMQIRRIEADAAAGRPLDVAQYVALTSVMLKLGDRLGYTRKQRRVSLQDVLRQHEEATQVSPASSSDQVSLISSPDLAATRADSSEATS